MKKFTLLFASLLCVAYIAVAQLKLYVYQNDGTRTEFVASTVDSIAFSTITDGPDQPDDPIKPVDPTNGYEYVDLGLPSGTKWAAENLGTDSIDTLGQYYAWGEIATKKSFYTESAPSYNKRFADLYEAGIIGEDSVLTAEHDAATAILGEACRMSTKEDFQELIDNCTFNLNLEAKGYDVVGKNGKSI